MSEKAVQNLYLIFTHLLRTHHDCLSRTLIIFLKNCSSLSTTNHITVSTIVNLYSSLWGKKGFWFLPIIARKMTIRVTDKLGKQRNLYPQSQGYHVIMYKREKKKVSDIHHQSLNHFLLELEIKSHPITFSLFGFKKNSKIN